MSEQNLNPYIGDMIQELQRVDSARQFKSYIREMQSGLYHLIDPKVLDILLFNMECLFKYISFIEVLALTDDMNCAATDLQLNKIKQEIENKWFELLQED